MSDPVIIVKPVHTVIEFTDMIERYNGANKKTAYQGKFEWKNEMEEVLFYYSLLGKDAVVWDQQIKILKDQDIFMKASEAGDINYMFTYFLEANKPIYIDSGRIFDSKSLIFTNDQGSYHFTMPKGYEGHILQIILSGEFVRNYVPSAYLQHELVDRIVNKSSDDVLLLRNVPSYVHVKLLNIAERMVEEGAGMESKLHMLQSLAVFLDIFFKRFIAAEKKYNQSQIDKKFIKEVKSLMAKNRYETFWGLEFYAAQLGTTTSTFKRKFDKHFKTTPLDYFKQEQHKYAKRKLQTGKYTVTDIAFKLGYTSNANFVRSYQKYMGNSPGKDKVRV